MTIQMNKIATTLIIAIFIFLQLSCAGKHEDPPHKMIDMSFFKCEASKSLKGGIWGKGPFKEFGPEESLCSENEWIKIDKKEFKKLATVWYTFDWSKEIPWFNSE